MSEKKKKRERQKSGIIVQSRIYIRTYGQAIEVWDAQIIQECPHFIFNQNHIFLEYLDSFTALVKLPTQNSG